jgi:phosphoribosylamine--glycine ligase
MGGPKVIEFNCRFGDPESQVILPIWPGNLADALLACAEGRITDLPTQEPVSAAVCVVLAAKGYPDAYEKGIRLRLPGREKKESIIFHAGTKAGADGIVSSGGRVLNAVGLGDDIAKARKRAYALAQSLLVRGLRYREDIAAD